MRCCTDSPVCGYARQDKVWARDPDGNFWEVYVVEGEVEPAVLRRSLEGPAARLEAPSGPVVWTHFVTEPWNGPIPHADDSVDEVRLEGSCNVLVPPGRLDALLAEAFRVLRPGGRVALHGLVGDRPFRGTPRLPGLASLVQHVPVETEPLEALRRAGFGGLFYEKLGGIHCFQVDGVELRELRLVGWKSGGAAWPTVAVVYKGPFEQVTDEDGTVYRRGDPVVVSWAQAERLRLGPAADQFTFLAS